MLKIKLVPTGKKHDIRYRIGVTEARSKVSGSLVELLGYYHPKTNELKIDKNLLESWQKKGAQLTEGLNKVLKTWKPSSSS